MPAPYCCLACTPYRSTNEQYQLRGPRSTTEQYKAAVQSSSTKQQYNGEYHCGQRVRALAPRTASSLPGGL
eukprot:984184-Rhodomonas_salina.1